MINRKDLKQFYTNLLGNMWYRDVRLLGGKTPYPRTTMSRFKHKPIIDKLNVSKITTNELLSYSSRFGTCVCELTYYTNEQDYRNAQLSKRHCNWIFFDLDSKSQKLKPLKDRLNAKGITYEERLEIAKEFKELLMTSDVLDQPWKEAKALANQLAKQGIPTFPVFSAGSGFHLHCFFPPTPIGKFKDYQKAVERFAMDQAIILYLSINTMVYPQVAINRFLDSYPCFLDNYEVLKEMALVHLSFDPAPIRDAHKRVVRVPYSTNPKTMLSVTPFTFEQSLEEVLEIANNPKEVVEFDINDYVSSQLLYELQVSDILVDLESIRNMKKQPNNRFVSTNNYVSMFVDPPFNDMRLLLDFLCGQYKAKDYSHYSSFMCMFHQDNRPSMIVSAYKCRCTACGVEYNYFDFIKAYYKLDSDNEVKAKIKEIKEDFQQGGDRK